MSEGLSPICPLSEVCLEDFNIFLLLCTLLVVKLLKTYILSASPFSPILWLLSVLAACIFISTQNDVNKIHFKRNFSSWLLFLSSFPEMFSKLTSSELTFKSMVLILTFTYCVSWWPTFIWVQSSTILFSNCFCEAYIFSTEFSWNTVKVYWPCRELFLDSLLCSLPNMSAYMNTTLSWLLPNKGKFPNLIG